MDIYIYPMQVEGGTMYVCQSNGLFFVDDGPWQVRQVRPATNAIEHVMRDSTPTLSSLSPSI